MTVSSIILMETLKRCKPVNRSYTWAVMWVFLSPFGLRAELSDCATLLQGAAIKFWMLNTLTVYRHNKSSFFSEACFFNRGTFDDTINTRGTRLAVIIKEHSTSAIHNKGELLGLLIMGALCRSY